ncbi:DUF5057 domain-containing protein [Cohnella sp. GCM10012308]|uniref:DUF5057 domain-containing protein n=1 Tax=Cohnella sp. GCM10012308 TaxID=3317329 RepID=UPI0036124D9C
MSQIRKWLSLLLVAVLVIGGVPVTAFGPAHTHAATYSVVTITGTTPNNGVKNVVLNGTQLQLGTGTAAKFIMTDWGDGTVSFRAQSNGMLVTASGTNDLAASATAVKITETFKKDASGTSFTFKSLSNGKFLTTSASNSSANATVTIKANSDTATDAKQKFTITDVSPISSKQEIRVLEITDDGTSDLLPILSTYNDPVIKIDSIRMKQFVAQRDELDGRYDAIYIGKGAYNATLVSTSGQNHDTKSIMNDITNLKFKELKDYYIDRGLPVIVYSQQTSSTSSSGALYQNTAGILKAGLSPYATSLTGTGTFVPTSNKSNVIFVGDSNLINTSEFLTKTDLINRAAERPRLVVTGKPIDYTANQNQIYVAGDTLSYTFNVANVGNIAQRSMTANLYIGIDSVLKFDSNNLIVSQPVTATTGNTLTFRLPKGYSGVHYWKLELVDQGSKLKDIQSGVLRFRDELTKINVLQILPTNGDTSSSLLKSNNMNQSYLKTDDYEITIKTMSMSTFNSSGYKTLNGYYDMLIFGFADSYNSSASIDKTAADAVNAYIATGQSVMFTHDTVFQGSTNWISYFQGSTGQLSPMTNMGLSAPHTSTTTKKVNEGLLTRFPFNISSVITQVNTTHDQYFGLKLEDPKLIPWYNITGGPRDDDDSWNHYYTYSYGNVTYSGTGHTNANFPDWEQRLFVNTMYRAFIGSNHAPIVNVSTPTNFAVTGKIIPSYNKVLLSYTAQDYDVIDRSLSTAVSFKYRASASDAWTEKQVKAYSDVKTGDIVTESYDNPLPNGGELVIYVTAKDKSGASATQTVTTQVVKVTANVDLSRTLSANVVNNQIEKNVPFTMTYTITPKSIPFQNGINADDLVIKNFKLDEKLPVNLEVLAADTSPLLLNPAVSGTLAAGYRLTGSLADIQYRLSQDGKNFVADPVSFTVKVTPKQNGSYLLDNSYLNFTDFYVNGATVTKDIERSLQFQPYQIQAVTKMASLSLSDTIIAKGDESKLTPVIGPDDTSNKTLSWTSDRPDLVTVDAAGIIKGIAEGTAKITATATDGSGLTAVSNVTVVVPGINIVGPNTVNVDDTINLEAKLVLANETLTGLTWSIGSGQSTIGELGNGADDMKKILTGVNAGPIDITVVATTSKGKTYTKTYRITVIQPIQLTLPADIHIGLGTEWKRDLWTTALGVTPLASKTGIQSYTTWTSGDAAIVEAGANNGVVIGKKTGSATVGASYQKNPKTTPVTASTRVTVVDLSVPEQVTLGKGKTLDVKALVSAAPSDVSSTVMNRLTWSDESGKDFASVGAATGIVTGTATGIENVTVTYRQTDGGPIVIQKTIQVNVVDIDGPASVTIGKGKSLDLNSLITALPSSMSDAMLANLTWRDEAGKNFASVNAAGIVSGTETGSEDVTVEYRAVSGGPVIASRTIKVKVVALSGPEEVEVGLGGTIDLKKLISGAPADLSAELLGKLYWSDESGKTIASVTAAGIATGLAPGWETITVGYKETPDGPVIAEWKIKVNVISLGGPEQVTVGKGRTLTVQDLIEALPSNLSSQVLSHLEWSDEAGKSYASVNSAGVVTGVAAGSELVTAAYRPAPNVPVVTSWTIKVNVVDLGGPASVIVAEGGTLNLKALLTVLPATYDAEVRGHLIWTDEAGKEFASIAGTGIVTGKQAGIETVTASYKETANGPVIASWNIQVQVVKLGGPTQVIIAKDGTINLKDQITVLPAGLTDDVKSHLTWTDEEGKEMASVDPVTGIVKGLAPGAEKITATYKDADGRVIAVWEIVVNVVLLEGPTEAVVIKGGEPADLSSLIVVTPASLKNEVLTHLVWTDENGKSNASVDANGKVTGLAAGEETIKAEYKPVADGPVVSTLSIRVHVIEASMTGSVTLSSTGSSTVQLADTDHLKVNGSGDRQRFIDGLSWTIKSGDNYAYLNDKGQATAKSPGVATVLAEYKLPGSNQVLWSQQVKVNVVELTGRDVTVTLGLTRNLLGDLTRGPVALKSEIEGHLTWAAETGQDKLSLSAAGVVTGERSGTQKAMAIYTPSDGSPQIRAEFNVNVVPVELELPPTFTMLLDTQYNLSDKLGIKPIGDKTAILPFVTWSDTNGNKVVTLNQSGVLTAHEVGTETVTAVYANSSSKDEAAQAQTQIRVVSIAFPDVIEIGQGADPRDLKDDLAIAPDSMKDEILGHLTWQDETGKNIVDVDDNGLATGVQLGEEKITLIYKPSDGSPDIPVYTTVKVLPVVLGPPEKLTIKRNGTTDLSALLPSDLDAEVKKNLYWSIAGNDSTLADNEAKDNKKSGRLAASTAGTATVKVTYKKSGKDIVSKTFTIDIVELSLPPRIELTLSTPIVNYNLLDGNKGNLSILPSAPQSLRDSIVSHLKWFDSLTNDVLTVSSAGIVTPVKAGTEAVSVTYAPPADSPLIGEAITASTLIVIQNASTPSTDGREHGGDRY